MHKNFGKAKVGNGTRKVGKHRAMAISVYSGPFSDRELSIKRFANAPFSVDVFPLCAIGELYNISNNYNYFREIMKLQKEKIRCGVKVFFCTIEKTF